MKPIALLIVTSAISSGQVILRPPTSADYRARGLSLDAPAKPAPTGPGWMVHIGKLTAGSPKILTVLAALNDHRTAGNPDSTLTLDEFTTRLKQGEAFQFTRTLTGQTCPDCSGFGRVAIKTGSRTGDGKAPCATCKASGKTTILQPVDIRW